MNSVPQRIILANSILSPFAVLHGTGLGREHDESEDETRFPFQRDRDRIIHTQAFRRLKHKTQVFVAGKGDHYRTRLTHTMEVAQISRDMARTLGVNEDLSECIALAHDLGHTPFGHAGEEAMNEEMQRYGSIFEHNLQSLRTVTILEERSKEYAGLNLNREILEGLMKHRTPFDSPQLAQGDLLRRSPSIEAQIVNLADEIAYTAHDIDDGIRAAILITEMLRNSALYCEAEMRSEKHGTEVRGSIIHILVMDAYAESERRLQTSKISSLTDVYAEKTPLIDFSSSMSKKLAELRECLYEHFYRSQAVLSHSERGQKIIHTLFREYETAPPEKVISLTKRTESPLHIAIKDYIAGMTDQYASNLAASATSIGSSV